MRSGSGSARDGLGSVTRGTLILLVGTLCFVATNFVARVILVRNLSTNDFGEFYIALTLSGLLVAIGSLGLPSAVARSIPYANSDADRRAIVRTAFLLSLPLAIAAGAVLLLLSIPISLQYHSPILALTLQYFAVAVSASIFASQTAAIFQGFEDVRPNALFIQTLNPLLFIVFLLLLATGRVPLGYRGALLAFVAANVVALIAILIYYQLRIRRYLPAGPRNPSAGRKLILFALPLFAVGLFSFLSTSVDTLVLGFVHNNEAGPYGASLSLARLTLIGLGALAYILLPVMARYVRDGDTPSAGIIYGTATKWMVLAALPFALIFFTFPGESLAVVYNSSYASAALPLTILVVGAFASAAIGPASAAQVAYGQTRLLLYNNIAAALTDGLLSVLLIPPYGLVGAAIAWATATALIPVLAISELIWTQGVRPFEWTYPAALAATGIPLGLLFLHLPFTPGLLGLGALVLLTAIAFVLVVLVVEGITLGDRLLLEAVEGLLGRPLPGARWVGRRFRHRGQ